MKRVALNDRREEEREEQCGNEKEEVGEKEMDKRTRRIRRHYDRVRQETQHALQREREREREHGRECKNRGEKGEYITKKE